MKSFMLKTVLVLFSRALHVVLCLALLLRRNSLQELPFHFLQTKAARSSASDSSICSRGRSPVSVLLLWGDHEGV